MINPQWEIMSFDVSPREWGLAMWVNNFMNEHRKNSPSERYLQEDLNAQAFIGEYALHGHFTAQNVANDWHGWLPTVGGDKCDFVVNGKKIDVKTRRSNMNYERKDGDITLYIDDPEVGLGNQFKKPMDYYVFALWLPNLMKVQLLGWTTKQGLLGANSYKLYEKGSVLPGGREANQNLHSCKALDLESMGTFTQTLFSAEVEADAYDKAVEGIIF